MIKLISIIVPVFNEEKAISAFYTKLDQVLAPIEAIGKYQFEIIFNDNHSTDNSFPLLKELANNDSRVRIFRLSRNFGYQRSIYFGYIKCKGEAAIQLDIDLQDPPELINSFLEEWENGFEFVYGIRKKRSEGLLINITRKIFYRFLSRFSDVPIPVDAGEFRLIDRKIIEVLKLISDHQPYLRGLIASIGFRQKGIDYHRAKRVLGESKFNIFGLATIALDGITNYSIAPLRLMTVFGFFIFLFSIIAFLTYMISSFYHQGEWPAGFTTLALLILINLGVVSLFLGIIGEYLGRTFKQVKREPLANVQEEI
ncbi:MAG: glycosyltransferase [Halobacteriovoraceae bacterium]|nr:glycosyltransferase [Halobacteriovoraceae bacterium]|tara:strand:+ start:1508 stop:2443 length:936 start_codon:yes stop_codon:yes gene_type:complete